MEGKIPALYILNNLEEKGDRVSQAVDSNLLLRINLKFEHRFRENDASLVWRSERDPPVSNEFIQAL